MSEKETQEHFRNAIALTESENKSIHTIIGELLFYKDLLLIVTDHKI